MKKFIEFSEDIFDEVFGWFVFGIGLLFIILPITILLTIYRIFAWIFTRKDPWFYIKALYAFLFLPFEKDEESNDNKISNIENQDSNNFRPKSWNPKYLKKDTKIRTSKNFVKKNYPRKNFIRSNPKR